MQRHCTLFASVGTQYHKSRPRRLHPNAPLPQGPQFVSLAHRIRRRGNVEPPQAKRPFMHFLNAVDTPGMLPICLAISAVHADRDSRIPTVLANYRYGVSRTIGGNETVPRVPKPSIVSNSVTSSGLFLMSNRTSDWFPSCVTETTTERGVPLVLLASEPKNPKATGLHDAVNIMGTVNAPSESVCTDSAR
jgi:hypothetical protein